MPIKIIPSNATDPQIELGLSVGGSFFQGKELKIPIDLGPDHHGRVEIPAGDLSPPTGSAFFPHKSPRSSQISSQSKYKYLCNPKPRTPVVCLSFPATLSAWPLPLIPAQRRPSGCSRPPPGHMVVCLSALPRRVYQPFGPPTLSSVTCFLLLLPPRARLLPLHPVTSASGEL